MGAEGRGVADGRGFGTLNIINGHLEVAPHVSGTSCRASGGGLPGQYVEILPCLLNDIARNSNAFKLLGRQKEMVRMER